MKIAMPYQDGVLLEHFGRAKEFIIYNVSDLDPVTSEVIAPEDLSHAAVARVLKEHGVDVVLCGSIGEHARQAVEGEHMLVFSGITGAADDVLEDALDDVVNLATVSVGAMEQTTAKALRDAVKSGKASREELLALGKQVFDEVKAAISPQAQKVITDNLGSFDKYLTAVIEDAVLKVKQEDPYLTLSGELIKDAAPEDKAGAAAQ